MFIRFRESMAALSLVAAIALIGLGMAPAAVAQDQQQPGAAATTDIPDEKVDAFVDAALQVQEVQADYNARLQDPETSEDAAELQQQAQSEAAQAIEESGLSTDEYNQILEAANNDPGLYTEIVNKMEQRQQ